MATAIIQVRDAGASDQVVVVKKATTVRLDTGYTLKVEQTGLADGLDVEYKRKKRDDSQVFGPNTWTTRVLSFAGED